MAGLAVLLGAIAPAQQGVPASAAPDRALLGRSEGDGTLSFLLGQERRFHVESNGVVEAGWFRLDQAVTFADRPTRTRTWRLREDRPGHYAGTLSDAAGPVSAETRGRRLLLRYRVGGLLVMHQTLELMADDRTIDNVGRITLLGVTVGRLRETIRRRE